MLLGRATQPHIPRFRSSKFVLVQNDMYTGTVKLLIGSWLSGESLHIDSNTFQYIHRLEAHNVNKQSMNYASIH